MSMRFLKTILSLVLVFCMLNFLPNVIATAYDEQRALIAEKGDVNGDGEILTDDARLALSYAIGVGSLDLFEISRADMDSNGVVDTSDVISILRLCADLSVGVFRVRRWNAYPVE